MTMTIYGDFTDAACRIASTRVDALVNAGVDVEWRAIVQHPTTRVLSQPLDDEDRADIARVEEAWRSESITGEPIPWHQPSFSPAPVPPVSGYAEAVGAGVGAHVRHLLFSSYWQDGTDIGNPDVLRRLLTLPILHARSEADVLKEYGYAVAIGGGPITSDAWRLIRSWRTDYAALGSPELPAYVEDGQCVSGWEAVRLLGAHVAELDALFPRANPFPL